MDLHEKIKSAIVNDFCSQFSPNAKLLFLREAARKRSFWNESVLTKLGFSISEQVCFPDVVLYDSKKEWLFLIEASTNTDFISPKRYIELSKLFRKSRAGLIYVSAFRTLETYARNIGKLAWGTDVWIAEMPSHMIHLNGDKFLGWRQVKTLSPKTLHTNRRG